MVPRGGDNRLEFSFEIFEAELFEYGMKYNLITQLISGAGGFILIFCVILYLDGFKAMYKQFQENREENRRQKEEHERLQQEKNKNEAENKNGKKKGGKADGIDTQRSDGMSEDEDPNYGGGEDPAVHEGGSQGSDNRNRGNNIRRRFN